jgi:hypothetical protein
MDNEYRGLQDQEKSVLGPVYIKGPRKQAFFMYASPDAKIVP